jgi:endonuclease-3
VLSAQATDAGVNRATGPLFAVADTPDKMLALGEEGVREAIKSVGLFNTKAKNVIALSGMLVEAHGGQVPRELEALRALPGVGRKTANVVLNTGFGQPVNRRRHARLPRRGTAPGWPRARTPMRWKPSWSASRRSASGCTRTTGSSCMAAMSAWRASRNARSA